MAIAIWISFSETPEQSCVVNVTSTRLYTLNHSGWWSNFSANNAVRDMNDHACEKSVKKNVFLMAFDECSSPSLLIASHGNGDASDNLFTDDLTASGESRFGDLGASNVSDDVYGRRRPLPASKQFGVVAEDQNLLRLAFLVTVMLLMLSVCLPFKTPWRKIMFMMSHNEISNGISKRSCTEFERLKIVRDKNTATLEG